MISLLPNYLTTAQLWIDLLPIPIGAALISLVAAALTVSVEDRKMPLHERWLIFMAFALLGLVIGDLTGQSREAAVPATIGAVLTLLGAAMVYLLGSKGLRQQVFVATAVSVLTFSLLFGTNWGSVLRSNAELFKQSARYRWSIELENQKLEKLRALEKHYDATAAR